MDITRKEISDVIVIEPKVFKDDRGYFYESFSEREFNEKTGLNIKFVQDNQSKSCANVIRGLHFQKDPHAQSKLVRCVLGEILDVAVDLRKDSDTYGKYVSEVLSEDNHKQLFIPKGFAHGFSVLSDTAIVQYKCDDYYHPECEGGLTPFDENVKIDWQIDVDNAIVKERDKNHPKLSDLS